MGVTSVGSHVRLSGVGSSGWRSGVSGMTWVVMVFGTNEIGSPKAEVRVNVPLKGPCW
jgi:hypothetical protein